MNVVNIEQSALDQYIGDHVDSTIEQLRVMYHDFDVQKLHHDLMVTADYIYNRIRVRHDNQFRVTGVTHG